MYDFIDQDNKEWNLTSVTSLLPSNVVLDIKAIPIPSCSIEDMVFWGFSQDERFTRVSNLGKGKSVQSS